jgi:hypothetical protein
VALLEQGGGFRKQLVYALKLCVLSFCRVVAKAAGNDNQRFLGPG